MGDSSNRAVRVSEGTELADTALESFESNGEEQTERFIAGDLYRLRAKGGNDYFDFVNRMQDGLNFYLNTDKADDYRRLYGFVTRHDELEDISSPLRPRSSIAPPAPPPILPLPPVQYDQQQKQQVSHSSGAGAGITTARNPVGSNPNQSQTSSKIIAMKKSKLPFGKSGQIGVKSESVFVGIGAVVVVVSAITMILSRSKDAPTYTALVPIGGALLAIGAAYNGFTSYEAEKKLEKQS